MICLRFCILILFTFASFAAGAVNLSISAFEDAAAHAKPGDVPPGYVLAPKEMTEKLLTGNTVLFPPEPGRQHENSVAVMVASHGVTYAGVDWKYGKPGFRRFANIQDRSNVYLAYTEVHFFQNNEFCYNEAVQKDGTRNFQYDRCTKLDIYVKKEFVEETPPPGVKFGFLHGGDLFSGNVKQFPLDLNFSNVMVERTAAIIMKKRSEAGVRALLAPNARQLSGRAAVRMLIGNTVAESFAQPDLLSYYAQDGRIVQMTGNYGSKRELRFYIYGWKTFGGYWCQNDVESLFDNLDDCHFSPASGGSGTDMEIYEIKTAATAAMGEMIGLYRGRIVYKGDSRNLERKR